MLNDQLGRGRSSTTAVMILLIQRWLRRDRQPASAMSAPVTPTRDRSRHGMPRKMATLNSTPSKADREKESQGEKGEVQHGRAGSYRATWQIINSCLRVIKNGTEVKRVSNISCIVLVANCLQSGQADYRRSMKLSTPLPRSSTFGIQSRISRYGQRMKRIRARRMIISRRVRTASQLSADNRADTDRHLPSSTILPPPHFSGLPERSGS